MSQQTAIRLPIALLFGSLLMLLVIGFAPSTAQQRGNVIEAVLLPNPQAYDGPCPAVIKFTGTISTNGPVTVQYRFTRSDGAIAPMQTLVFEGAGTKEVSTTWTLGAAAGDGFNEWQAIEISQPNKLTSNRALFKGMCLAGQGGAASQQDQRSQAAPDAGAAGTPQSGKQMSPTLEQAMKFSQRDSAARADARKKAFEADRARFGPMAKALAEALKTEGVDLDGYLAASKQFVETPPEKTSQASVDEVNRKFAQPIRAAIAKAFCLPGVGDLLQDVQSQQDAPEDPTPGQRSQSNSDTGQTSCCSTNRFEPPFIGLGSEGDLGSRSTGGPVETRQLRPSVRSAIAFAPHERVNTGKDFTVPANARHVSVTVTLGTSWVIGLAGLGYSHVWLGLDMQTSDRNGVVCSDRHLEQDNQWTHAGGFGALFDHRPGPNITMNCRFERNPGDPTGYAVNIAASADGTFVGLSGGYGHYFVNLGPVDVTSCP